MDNTEVRTLAAVAAGSWQGADPREEQLEAVYDRCGDALFRYACAILGSSEDAEDAVQDVFVKLARDPRLLASALSPGSYLFRAVRNAAYELLRRRRRAGTLETELRAEGSEGDSLEERVVLSETLSVALAELPVEQREVLVLKACCGLTFAEIAGVLRQRPNTAASRYRYAIARLRAILEAGDE